MGDRRNAEWWRYPSRQGMDEASGSSDNSESERDRRRDHENLLSSSAEEFLKNQKRWRHLRTFAIGVAATFVAIYVIVLHLHISKLTALAHFH